MWIEILNHIYDFLFPAVTACEGCVDWNKSQSGQAYFLKVTACEGCVDWNASKEKSGIYVSGHSLRGLCGLKLNTIGYFMHYDPSQPARAVWIEIIHTSQVGGVVMRHSLRGLCGLKFPSSSGNGMLAGHSLRGLCGLKFHPLFPWARIHMSQPARAVWIEILLCLSTFRQAVVTACEGCVDWNCCLNAAIACSICHSLRGLCGLKSCSLSPSQTFWLVTACEGCVDWNSILLIFFHVYPVTACEGCVDWNVYFAYWYIACYSHSLRGLCRLKCTRLPIRC